MKAADKLIQAAIQDNRQARELARVKAENKELIRRLEVSERRSGLIDDLRASARAPTIITTRKSRGVKRQAAAVVLCSDWHVGERVDPKKVNGVNEYNPQIAEGNAKRLADAVTWMVKHHRSGFDISDVVVWLGGDLITGYLHDDQKQSNYMPPSHEVLLVQDLIGHLLDSVLSIDGVKSVRVPCSYGNHGRTTPKPQIATGADNSFEWLLYHQIRRTYAAQKRVEWSIADGEFCYLDVYGKRMRFTHGDATKYQGGVGGITIPINKAIARWQTYQHADVTCMGHYHQYLDTPGLVINGSLIGAAPYGMRVGSHEEPTQAFFLMDSKRGKCQSTPLWTRESM